jgi:molecular chaperone HscB
VSQSFRGDAPLASRDFFSLFGLSPKFLIDLSALESAWRSVQAAVHPDRFASGTDSQRLMALRYSTQVNEAHETLKDPIKRASYLCQINGVEIDAERNTAMPSDFLMQQMEWRESMEDAVAACDTQGLAQLMLEVEASLSEAELLVGHLLDSAQPDYVKAAQEVRRMMFLAKFKSQLCEEQRQVSHGLAANR